MSTQWMAISDGPNSRDESVRIDIVPIGDLIDHDTVTDDCECGPRVQYVDNPDGDRWMYVHRALDGRATR